MKRRKKALVTGATGFVGSNLVRKLLNLNYEVHVLIRKTSNPWRIRDVSDKINCHYVNLIDKAGLQKEILQISPSVIFHLANAGLYGGNESSTKEYLDTNFLGTVNLIECSKDLDYVCFVNTGSSAEYGSKDEPMDENDLCEPESIYGITKLASTIYAKNFAKKNHKPIVTLRLFSPFGAFDNSLRLIPYVITRTIKNQALLFKKPDTVRDYIFIEDVTESYIRCIKNAKKVTGEIINIGSGRQTSTKEVVRLILSICNSNSRIRWGGKFIKRNESKVWQANIKKARLLLDWTPKYSLKRGLKETVGWFKDNIKYY